MGKAGSDRGHFYRACDWSSGVERGSRNVIGKVYKRTVIVGIGRAALIVNNLTGMIGTTKALRLMELLPTLTAYFNS